MGFFCRLFVAMSITYREKGRRAMLLDTSRQMGKTRRPQYLTSRSVSVLAFTVITMAIFSLGAAITILLSCENKLNEKGSKYFASKNADSERGSDSNYILNGTAEN